MNTLHSLIYKEKNGRMSVICFEPFNTICLTSPLHLSAFFAEAISQIISIPVVMYNGNSQLFIMNLYIWQFINIADCWPKIFFTLLDGM